MKILIKKTKENQTHVNRIIRKYPDVIFATENFSDEIYDADAVIGMRVTSETLTAAKKLKWIQSMAAGIENVPLGEYEEKGIILTNASGAHILQMAEYAVSMMILSARNLHKFILAKQNKIWSKGEPQDEILNKNLGIIGLGSIGKEIAKKANFMGMNVYGAKKHPEEIPGVKKVFSSDNMDWIFSNCDFIIILLPDTESTHQIINKKYFDMAKTTATIINMGRGATVNENDLIEALRQYKFKLYISDVFRREPLPEDSPLWEMENVIITPHICGKNINSSEKIFSVIEPNIDAFIKGKPLINVVSYKEGY